MSSEEKLSIELTVTTGVPRLDQALLLELKRSYPALSRNRLKSLFDDRKILLDGKARSPSWSLVPGQYEITIFGGENTLSIHAQEARASLRGSFLPVVYEDDEALVLNKASGVSSVPHSSDETETAVGSALAHFPKLQGVGRGGLEPGLLHRLDTGTSGLLAFAKTNSAFERLQKAWREGSVTKIYRAWVIGNASELRIPTSLHLTLAHHPRSAKRMIVVADESGLLSRDYRGKPLPSLTELRALHSVHTFQGQTVSDLEVRIQTGVMHQIRCTLAHLGFAIAGDPIYSPAELAEKFPRLMLHAWKLSIPRAGGSEIHLTADLPFADT